MQGKEGEIRDYLRQGWTVCGGAVPLYSYGTNVPSAIGLAGVATNGTIYQWYSYGIGQPSIVPRGPFYDAYPR
jgi:hypothetical protein